MDDLLEDFIAETRETLETLAGQLVQWERTPQDRALVDSVFRFVHTVKGSCGFLDLPRLLRLSHAAEDLLSGARDGDINASAGLVSAVLAVIDRISALTDALETGQTVHDNDDDLINAMLAFLLCNGAVNSNADNIDDTSLPSEIDDHLHKAKNRTVRMSLNLLDKLMSGVSDMVLARNEVSRQLRKSGPNGELEIAFSRLSTSVAEMRDAVSMMRMQNIDRLFSSLPRLLRDISIELNKEIELRIDGSEVEIDREMVEALRDPLTHILRNAADHGIESTEERRAMGKNPTGQIRIIARQSGNQILIEIIDDGRGINLEKLGLRVIAAKVATSAEWQKMSEKDQLNAIFTPGLSTADQVSAISGRGVGMDVVRTNLRAIGGTIDLENHHGHGLKMTLRLPLTLSIIAGLSISVGDQIFGISRSSVVEILSSNNSNVKIENLGGASVASIRDQRYPYARLETLLDLEEAITPTGISRTLIVIRPAIGSIFVIDVAQVIDNEELVVKPGAPLVMATGLYAGTSLPDNGRPMLLLDATGLANAIGVDMTEYDMVPSNTVKANATRSKFPSALLFVGLDGAKRAIRLSVIDRMEDVEASHIQFIAGKTRASVDNKLIDVWNLEDIPASGLVKMLKLTDGQTNKYLAVEDVLDIFTLDGEIVPSAQPELHEGVVNAFGDAVELINAFRYFEAAEGLNHSAVNAPLCFIDCNEDASWERQILAPLLAASGYHVSFDGHDRERAAIVLNRQGIDPTPHTSDARVLHLRDTSHASRSSGASIYRYDRVGLISAIEAKLVGAA